VTLLDDPNPEPSAGISERNEISMPSSPRLSAWLRVQFVLDLVNRFDNLLLRPVHVNLVVEPFLDDAVHVLVDRGADYAPAVLFEKVGEIRPAAASETRNGVCVMINSTLLQIMLCLGSARASQRPGVRLGCIAYTGRPFC